MKKFADKLRLEIYAMYLAYKDPRTPWYVKLIAAVIVAYALSPIDLIPDFIPVLGYLDDVILIPLGLILVRKLINPEVLADCRQRAATELCGKCFAGYWVAAVIVIIWILLIGLAIVYLARHFRFNHHG
jgi:uncharacterized membrane protein YkvA (DUF1232 family)